ncbi:MAG TPA: phosphoribosyltransferase [Balneolales bacterium]|nr:phosphoribosyltransferase [Balneolales bacterium]
MFKDREDAGTQLAKALRHYKDKNVVVLAIPRGGVEVGYYVAKYLNATLSLLISRKLGYPDNPEAAFGAIAEDGSTYIFGYAKRRMDQQLINQVIEGQKTEIDRRVEELRKGQSLPDIKDKTVILVDDGIATGATLFASIACCKNKMAKKIIVAAPVSGRDVIDALEDMVDEVIVLEIPDQYFAVSQGYEHFYNVPDEEVLEFMNRWDSEQKTKDTNQLSKTQS